MNVSEYMIHYLKEKGVTHYFGYQGTMISYFVDALYRIPGVHNHSCYNEQGAAFAACGMAQASGQCAVAYSTSGPGAANLLSGVANAYMDSEPVLFITGQVNTYEYTDIPELRQQSFQELNVVDMAKPVTKYCVQITCVEDVRYHLEKAWHLATTGRPGPVLLDIPMNIQRSEIHPETLRSYEPEKMVEDSCEDCLHTIEKLLQKAARPILLVGGGVHPASQKPLLAFARSHHIPIVTSLLGKSLLPHGDELNFGYLGTYGMRIANLLAGIKADLLVCIGISMCTRQTGVKVEQFAPHAQLIRIDVDPDALRRKVRSDDLCFAVDADQVIAGLGKLDIPDFSSWLSVCLQCRAYLEEFDRTAPGREPNRIVEKIAALTTEGSAVASDVGQHMMWVGQSLAVKKGQRVLFSGGHGAMGYALPAAIGAYYHTGKPSFMIAGDGSFQMNIQELQWVVREHLPIKMFVLNNHVLGMIRFQQNDYFEGRYGGAARGFDYAPCDFVKVAQSYGIRSFQVTDPDELDRLQDEMHSPDPVLIEILLPDDTSAVPKTFLGKPVYNQRPYIPEEKLEWLINL